MISKLKKFNLIQFFFYSIIILRNGLPMTYSRTARETLLQLIVKNNFQKYFLYDVLLYTTKILYTFIIFN